MKANITGTILGKAVTWLLNIRLKTYTTFEQWPQVGGAGLNSTVTSNCNGLTFVNAGAVNVLINGFPLAAQNSLVVSGNLGDYETATFQITWQGSTVPTIWVIKKEYI